MFKSYCGPDIRSWSAPVEDLSNWCDEGPIFTYPIGDQWDVMYAPDLVEVKRKDDGMRTIPGSIMGFDPAVFIEYVTDPKDPDYEIGFRAYGFR